MLTSSRWLQASAVGDFDQAADRWRDVLRAYPGRPALWRNYLAFRQTHFASFTARKLRHLHDDAMDVSCTLCSELKHIVTRN
jgi:NRDE-2, necessary for RNA interference